MKKRYSIGFFSVAAIAMIAVLAAYQFSYNRALEKAKEEALQVQIEAEEEETATVRTEGEASKEECYYLMEVNGYVVAYLSDKKTAYEYTDILVEELPMAIREELKNGKYMEGKDALYGFLENYSS